MKIGLISLLEADLSAGKQDLISTENERVIGSFFAQPPQFVSVRVEVDPEKIRAAIVRFCDDERCALVFTLGGSGPRAGDMAPDVTRSLLDRELPGFGEIMRQYSYERIRISILSRATAGVRGNTLVLNLPSRPKPVKFCLRLIREGLVEAIELLTGEHLILRDDVVVIPLEKYLPFMKYLRIKPDPRE